MAWVDQEVFQIRKVDFYDRRGDLLKTLTLDDYRLYDDQYWRALTLRMVIRTEMAGSGIDPAFFLLR